MRLILGDCLKEMGDLEPGSVDLILTSPPYDQLRDYGSGCAFDFEGVASGCVRLIRPGGVIVWVVNDQTKGGSESGTSFRQALHFKSLGLLLYDTMIYEKTNPLPLNHPRYEQCFEFMFVLSKGKPRTVNVLTEPCRCPGKSSGSTHRRYGDSLSGMSGKGKPIKAEKPRGNIWKYGVGRNSYTDHPAVFPLSLAVDHILSWTEEGDIVLDPFVGSGTTLEACMRTGRRGIGIEIDPTYHAIAHRRIEAALSATPLFSAV